MAAEPGAAIGVGEEEEERYVRDGGITIGDIYIPPAPAPAMSFEANGPRWAFLHPSPPHLSFTQHITPTFTP